MAMANISHISKPALAAGAIWIQMESTLAAVQQGWLQTTSMRTLVLLGKVDPGAAKSFTVMCSLSALLVALTNVPLLIWSARLSALVSNDPEVQSYFSQIAWVLVIHTQTRILSINAGCLFVPIGRGTVSVVINFVSFYVVATPIVGVLALSDLVTESVATKMKLCVCGTSMAQVPIALIGFGYLARLDWIATAQLINNRANSDKHAATQGESGAEVEGLAELQSH